MAFRRLVLFLLLLTVPFQAAVGATGDYLERGVELQRAGADALVIDIAHGHSLVMARAILKLGHCVLC